MPGGSVGVIIRPLLLMVKMYNTKLNYRNRAGATAPVSQNAKNRTFVLSQGVNAMKITVIQVNNELASTGVSVYVDGQLLGSIGPGGSISASVDASACRLLVECGVYRQELTLEQSAVLQVSWGLTTPEMIVSHAKK